MNEAEAMGQRLRDLRQGAGFSQPQLAEAAGVPVASLRNWEYGRRALMLSSAYRLARAMGITLDLLAGRVFEQPPAASATAPPADVAQEATSGGKTAGTPSRQKKPVKHSGKGKTRRVTEEKNR
jgi:transcriptional regulator with XRE-family HTH domain